MASLTQLEYLLALHKEGHFAKAAELCHVSQPSLSLMIQKLEIELGVVIFDRSKKPILPTEVGLKIIEQAKHILKEEKKLHTIASSYGNQVQGDFHLAVIPTLSAYLIPYFIQDFAQKYPEVNLKINEYKTKDIIKMLASDELDAGILVTPLNDHRVIEKHLFFEPFYAYISKEHNLNSKKMIEDSDLSLNDLWPLEEGHCFREQMLKVCTKDKKRRALPNVEFASENLETLRQLVKKSSGFTILPELAVLNLDITEYKNFVRSFKKPVPTREVSLVYGRSFLKENIIIALENCILDNLPKRLKSLKRDQIEIIDL